MVLLSLLSFVLGGLTVLGLVVVGGSLVARPLLEILTPGAGAVPAVVAWGSLAYAFVALGAGGFVTAWTAPRAPLRHTLVLGVVVAGVAPLAPWPSGPGPVGGAVIRGGLALVATLLGGYVHVRPGAGDGSRPER